jgi:hypothetical protein
MFCSDQFSPGLLWDVIFQSRFCGCCHHEQGGRDAAGGRDDGGESGA